MWKMVGGAEGTGSRRRKGYMFYKKPVSSKLVTPYRSAQATNAKIASLSQDVFRTLANCNYGVSIDEQVELLEVFSERLRVSGYPWKVAARILRNGIVCYNKKKSKAVAENMMFHRPEEDSRLERRWSKLMGRSMWFKPKSKSGKNGDDASEERGTNGGGFTRGAGMETGLPVPRDGKKKLVNPYPSGF